MKQFVAQKNQTVKEKLESNTIFFLLIRFCFWSLDGAVSTEYSFGRVKP